MLVLKIILIFTEIVCGLLLVAIILMQRTRGQGLGMAFGAEMGESLFGARAGNVLITGTIWLGAIFLINTGILARIYAHEQTSSSVMERYSGEQPAAPQGAAPTGPLPPPAAGVPLSESPVAPAPDFSAPAPAGLPVTTVPTEPLPAGAPPASQPEAALPPAPAPAPVEVPAPVLTP